MEPPSESRPPSPPRRTLTLLFSDLSDSTVLAGSCEPEDYLEILKYLRSHCLRVVPQYGGTIVDFSGDGFLAMFGYPESSEDDPRRAVEAALTMHEVMRRAPFGSRSVIDRPLALHSGIHSGRVLVIENDLFPGRFAVVGEAPNLAAKLSDVAGRDEILVSATTLGGESHFFDVRDRGDLALPGKSDAVPAYQVLGLSPAHTAYEARERRGLTPFVGRSDVHAALRQHLEVALAGSVRVVYVTGAPGLGKTRAVREFLTAARAAHGCDLLQGYCESTAAAEPLQPFLQMLRAIEAEHETDGEAPPGRPTAQALGQLRDAIVARARRRPLLMFIDDWHWVDDATRQMLAAIRELRGVAMLVVVASRTVLQVDPGAVAGAIVALQPLAEGDVAQAIRVLRPDLDPFVVRHIQQLAGGNPLFLEELCHFASLESLASVTQTTDTAVALLGTLIESRVNRLPEHQSSVVRAAAVIGRVVPGWLLEQVSGCNERDARIAALVERDVIFPGEIAGTLRFKHGVTRDVVYYSIGRRERSELHLRIAQLLEAEMASRGRDDMYELLAYHYQAGGDAVRASRYAELAGDRALAAAALDRARGHYRVALDHLSKHTASDATARQFTALAQRMGLACVYDPTRDHLDVFRRAVDVAHQLGDEATIARAEYWLGYIHYALGELPEAIRHCEMAQHHCQMVMADTTAADPVAQVELEAFNVQNLATLGQARAAAGEYEGVLDQLDAAASVKRRHRSGARPAVGFAYTLACKGGVLADFGRFAEADDCFAEALEVVRGRRSPVEASVLSWKSAVHLWRGQWHEAIDCAARVQTIAERIESLYVLSMAEAIAGYARWILQRDAGEIDVMMRATSWLEARDKRLYISMNYGWIADALVDAGRGAEARQYAAGALRRARRRDPFGAAMAYRALARLAPPRRGGPSPRDYLALAVAAARQRRSPHEEAVTWLHVGHLEARTGNRREALECYDRAHATFTTLGMTWHQAELQRDVAGV